MKFKNISNSAGTKILARLCSLLLYIFIDLYIILNIYIYILSKAFESQRKILLVTVGFTHDSCLFHAYTRSYLQSVLICDLHEKMELSSPSIPPAKRRGNESLRLTREYDATRCHFAEKISGVWRSPQSRGDKQASRNVRVLKPKCARLIFPNGELKKLIPQIGSRLNRTPVFLPPPPPPRRISSRTDRQA